MADESAGPSVPSGRRARRLGGDAGFAALPLTIGICLMMIGLTLVSIRVVVAAVIATH